MAWSLPWVFPHIPRSLIFHILSGLFIATFGISDNCCLLLEVLLKKSHHNSVTSVRITKIEFLVLADSIQVEKCRCT